MKETWENIFKKFWLKKLNCLKDGICLLGGNYLQLSLWKKFITRIRECNCWLKQSSTHRQGADKNNKNSLVTPWEYFLIMSSKGDINSLKTKTVDTARNQINKRLFAPFVMIWLVCDRHIIIISHWVRFRIPSLGICFWQCNVYKHLSGHRRGIRIHSFLTQSL